MIEHVYSKINVQFDVKIWPIMICMGIHFKMLKLIGPRSAMCMKCTGWRARKSMHSTLLEMY